MVETLGNAVLGFIWICLIKTKELQQQTSRTMAVGHFFFRQGLAPAVMHKHVDDTKTRKYQAGWGQKDVSAPRQMVRGIDGKKFRAGKE